MSRGTRLVTTIWQFYFERKPTIFVLDKHLLTWPHLGRVRDGGSNPRRPERRYPADSFFALSGDEFIVSEKYLDKSVALMTA
jgi:hypothetical protein